MVDVAATAAVKLGMVMVALTTMEAGATRRTISVGKTASLVARLTLKD